MKKIRENAGVIALGLVEIVIGVLLLINPVGFTSGIIIGLGALLLGMGVLSIIRYFRMRPAEAAREQSLARGLGLAIGGLFCVLHSEWFIATFPLLTLLYGVFMLMTSLVRIQWTVDALRLKKSMWKWLGLSAALSLVLALLIIANPFTSVNVMWMLVAVSLIAEAAADIIAAIVAAKAQ